MMNGRCAQIAVIAKWCSERVKSTLSCPSRSVLSTGGMPPRAVVRHRALPLSDAVLFALQHPAQGRLSDAAERRRPVDVGAWLRNLELGQYEAAFREHEIDGEVLPDLTDADLEKLGVLMGHRKRLLKAGARISGSHWERAQGPPVAKI